MLLQLLRLVPQILRDVILLLLLSHYEIWLAVDGIDNALLNLIGGLLLCPAGVDTALEAGTVGHIDLRALFNKECDQAVAVSLFGISMRGRRMDREEWETRIMRVWARRSTPRRGLLRT
ncbi:hypothetical protein V8F33_011895 [Rhypophila sp. PSN 637]